MAHESLRPLFSAVWELQRNKKRSWAEIVARQNERIENLVRFARERSLLYRRLYSHLPAGIDDLSRLPIVTKPELMENFDEWVTDPEVTRASVEEFIADPTLIGQHLLGRYTVWTTSGITGRRGIFVHDDDAQAVYTALLIARTSRQMRSLLSGGRLAALVVPGGHFTLTALLQGIRRRYPLVADVLRSFSVLAPLPELVRALNAFRPTSLIGYPTLMGLLVQERVAGRLTIEPGLVTTEGEWLSPATRARIEATFHCTVRDTYGASEFLVIASDCGHGWCHVNSDWVVLEPVDRANVPVPPGQASHTVLLTNLANRVQPIIRYDLGDSVTVSPDPCPCGSPFPAIRVEGRRDDILYMQATDGRMMPLLPLALVSVVEEMPAINRFQIVQVDPTTLRLRLETEVSADRTQTWEELHRRLYDYLVAQGVLSVKLELAPEGPQSDPASGKFRQVRVQSLVAADFPSPCRISRKAREVVEGYECFLSTADFFE
jgi:putative adenylate-forming enzyme